MEYVLKTNLTCGERCSVMHRFIAALPPGVTVGCDIFDGVDFMEITSIMWYPDSERVCVWVEDVPEECSEQEMIQAGWISGDLALKGD